MTVDDSRSFTITLTTPPVGAAKASIVSVAYPTTPQSQGASVQVQLAVKNIGDAAGVLWGRLIDTDTGGTVGAQTNTSSLAVGASATLTWNLTMPNKNWNLRAEAGHG